MQLQRQITPTDAVILSYAGNHGFDLFMPVNNFNQNVGTSLYGSYGNGTFDDVPTNSPDPRFATVQGFTTNAISNYNGFSAEYKHFDRRGLTTDISYTYSHALDDISNGGNSQLPYNGASVGFQITRTAVQTDVFQFRLRYPPQFRDGPRLRGTLPLRNKLVDFGAAGWTIGAKAYWRSGEPFSVFNTSAERRWEPNATGGTPCLPRCWITISTITALRFRHRAFRLQAFSMEGFNRELWRRCAKWAWPVSANELWQRAAERFLRTALFGCRHEPL